ncbi:MAG: hypothetical protein ACLSFT_01750 [Ruminococcus callidus]
MPQGQLQLSLRLCFCLQGCFRQGNSCFWLTCTFFSQQKETELSKIKCSGISEKSAAFSYKEKIGVFLAFFGKIEKPIDKAGGMVYNEY